MSFTKKVSFETITKTIEALNANNFHAEYAKTREDAKKRVLELLPQGAEVMHMTSVTLDDLGLSQELMEGGNHNPVKKTLMTMNRDTHGGHMQKLGAAAEWSVGSVHAITQDGKVLIASNSGSQLPGYAYGSPHVIWVVGAQKIVKDIDEGMKRIYEHVLPLESERAHKAYGVPGSFVSKLLIMNREPNPNRITTIIIDDEIGY